MGSIVLSLGCALDTKAPYESVRCDGSGGAADSRPLDPRYTQNGTMKRDAAIYCVGGRRGHRRQ